MRTAGKATLANEDPTLPPQAENVEPLFRAWQHGRLSLPNRVVMAPMTRAFSPDGQPGPDVAAYYRRRAENEVGLIISEGTAVDHPTSSPNRRVPNFWGPALDGWKRVVEEVHAAGGRIMPQLWHAGTGRDLGNPVWNSERPSASPSGIDREGGRTMPAMTGQDIQQVIDAFARAAAAAEELGFDGVELHGAHGYLIDSFLWDFTNRRTDHWGGDVVARTGFAIRLVEAVRREVSRDFPVVLRLSQWKGWDYQARLAATPEELGLLLAPLTAAGVDIYHCSTRRYWDAEFEGSSLNLAGWVKRLTGRPVITVGSVGLAKQFTRLDPQSTAPAPLAPLIERLEAEEFDLVAVGRALLADPSWARKVHEGRSDTLLGYEPSMQATLR